MTLNGLYLLVNLWTIREKGSVLISKLKVLKLFNHIR